MKTVSIVGGGLAGLSLGIALRKRNVPVEIFEAGTYPRHRVCGEFIAGVSDETLKELEIMDCLDDALSLSTTSWFTGGTRVLKRDLPSPARGLSRFKLDDLLARKFEGMGGQLNTGSRRGRDDLDPKGFVWATGREPSRSGKKWIGLKVHLHGVVLESDLELHLGRNGYAGISPVEGGAVNLCGLFRADSSIKGPGPEMLKPYLEAGGLSHLLDTIDHGSMEEDSFCAVAGMDYRLGRRPSSGFALGDNWALIPPFTGNGMSMAFESASLAAEPLAAWSRKRISWHEAVREYQASLKNCLVPRVNRARILHALLLMPSSRILLALLAKGGVLPFNSLYAMTH